LNLPLTQIIIISYVLAFWEFNLSEKTYKIFTYYNFSKFIEILRIIINLWILVKSIIFKK